MFKLFDHVDKALVAMESREGYASKSSAVWPSEASAVLLDQRKNQIVGKCHRQTFFRMIGEPSSDQIDAVAARRFRMGKLCEEDITTACKHAGIFVASGIKFWIADLELSPEIDLLVIDPETGQGYITENKSVYGYGAGMVIEKGEAKPEAIMQLALYLNEVQTGARLKEIIFECVRKKAELDAAGEKHRYRIEVDLENLERLSDGPLKALLAYESRDECQAREFELELYEDPLDGLHLPVIDGEVKRIFTIESIYERFEVIKAIHRRAVEEGRRRLAEQGFPVPDEPDSKGDREYWDRLAIELRGLEPEWWPPSEYEWRYSSDKIERLWADRLIFKTHYNEWKKGQRQYIGDWNCDYCGYRLKCAAVEYPELRHLILDIQSAA